MRAEVSVLLDLLLPTRCAICAATGDELCDSCRAGLTRLRAPRCDRCGGPTAWPVARCKECSGRQLAFARARAAVAHDDGARLLVSAWKERGLRSIAGLAAELVCEALPRPPVYTLTFVPADPDRRLERGHNPAENLATELGARWELPSPTLLERTAGIRPQRGLPLAERRRNVKDAFRVTERPPTKLALVDDVYTTGATVSAAATALRKAGARHVDVVTFARAVR